MQIGPTINETAQAFLSTVHICRLDNVRVQDVTVRRLSVVSATFHKSVHSIYNATNSANSGYYVQVQDYSSSSHDATVRK